MNSSEATKSQLAKAKKACVHKISQCNQHLSKICLIFPRFTGELSLPREILATIFGEQKSILKIWRSKAIKILKQAQLVSNSSSNFSLISKEKSTAVND